MADARHEYGEGKEPMPGIAEPTVIFMINKSLPHDAWTDLNIYRATQCGWVIGAKAREQAVYALGVSHGVVRGAYRIDGWRQVEERRWCFDGRSALELDVVDKSVARLKARQGNSNPVRHFLNGIPAPTPDDR